MTTGYDVRQVSSPVNPGIEFETDMFMGALQSMKVVSAAAAGIAADQAARRSDAREKGGGASRGTASPGFKPAARGAARAVCDGAARETALLSVHGSAARAAPASAANRIIGPTPGALTTIAL